MSDEKRKEIEDRVKTRAEKGKEVEYRMTDELRVIRRGEDRRGKRKVGGEKRRGEK